MGIGVDRYLAAEYIKGKVDDAYKATQIEAEEELAALYAQDGTTEVVSQAFEGAGKFRYSQKRKRHVVEYNMADERELRGWLRANPDAAADWAVENAKEFGEWHFGRTGEVPDGIARVEYDEPAKAGPPKVYGFDPDIVGRWLEEHGGWLQGAAALADGNELLLGDGE